MSTKSKNSTEVVQRTKLVQSLETSLKDFISGQNLSDADKAKEETLRPALIKALKGFNKSRFELGRMLNDYRVMLSANESFTGLLKALGLPRQSGYNILGDYKRLEVMAPAILAAAESLRVSHRIDIAMMANRELVDTLIEMDAARKISEKPAEELALLVAREFTAFKAKKQPPKPKDVKVWIAGLLKAAIKLNWDEDETLDAVHEAWSKMSKPKKVASEKGLSFQPNKPAVNAAPAAVQNGAA
jgi:hypothetical protein